MEHMAMTDTAGKRYPSTGPVQSRQTQIEC